VGQEERGSVASKTEGVAGSARGARGEEGRAGALPHGADTHRSSKREEVLSAALELMAERGIKGASLRELARRVGLSQPSLYHYFESKQELVAQIVERYTRLPVDPPRDLPDRVDLRAILTVAARRSLAHWNAPELATFSRFMLGLAFEQPEVAGAFRDQVLRRALDAARPWLAALVERGELRAEDGEVAVRAVVNSVAMRCIEERVLRGREPAPGELDGYADFVAEVVARGVAERAREGRG